MTIWVELQEKRLLQHGALLKDGEMVSSSFPKELKQHLAVAKQALNYIFKNVEKTKKAYNQAHMEIGKNNFSGFVLGDGILLICMYGYDMNQQALSQYVEENPQAFNALTMQ